MKHKHWFVTFFALLMLISSAAWATDINTAALSQSGWYSDDTRADDAVPYTIGTNLISPTLTDLPEQSSGVPGHTAEILEQIFFGQAPAGFPTGTHPGAMRLYIDAGAGAGGKTQVSHRKDDLTGHAAGSVLDDPSFFVDYSWMGNGISTFSAAFKIGFKTSEFGLAPVSGRTGENTWDKLLIFEPNQGGANNHSSNGTWWSENVTRTSGNWYLVDRVIGPGAQIPMTLAAMETSTIHYNNDITKPTLAALYALLTAGRITSVQLGVGSNNPGANVYVNQLATSFYRPGDVTTFGPLPPVHNVTQSLDYYSIQAAIDAANPGDVIVCDAGVYHERLNVNKSLDIRGAQYGVDPTPGGARTNPASETIIDVVGLTVPNPDVMIEIPAGVTNVSISGFTLNGGQSLPHNADQSAIRCWDDHITIQDNIIDGYTAVLYKGNDYFTAQRNRITANKGCVVVQPSAATYVTISDNILMIGGSPEADCKPIYMTGTAHTVVSGNVANGFTGYAALSGSNHTDVAVSGNTFTGNLKGVSFWGSTTFVTISGNTLSNSVGGSGIEIKGQNITISGNTITGNSVDGIKVDFHVLPTQQVTIFQNTIFGNGNLGLEVTPAVTQTVDAQQNYWGTTDYCSIIPMITGNADYDPWCNSDFTDCTYTAATSATVHNVTQNTHFCSLTAALTAAAPGDEIHADAGAIFHEHAIPIDKSVTLIGVPGDATPGTGPNPPVVNGDNNHYGFEFLDGAHDVVISGFEFTNFGASSSTGWGVPIFAWDVNTYNVTVSDNYMHHIEGNGVLVGSDYADQHSDWTITRNRLTDYGWVPSQDEAYGLELTNCSNGVISDNVIETESRVPGMAIRVSGRIADMHNVDVLNNYIRGTFVRCAIQVNAYDFEVSGAHLDDVRIEGNDIEISGAPRVVYLRDDVNGTAILSNVVIYDNKLVSLDNQLAVESLTDQTMNASANWWGDNTPAGLAAKMVGPVDYSPWLNGGTDANPNLGFHGDFSALWVDDDCPQTGALNRIQEAVSMVSGSTINIAPGTYPGQVYVSSYVGTMNIIGSGKANTFIEATASMPHSFATPTVRKAILSIENSTVNVSNLTIDGNGLGNTNNSFVGIAFWNSGGSMTDMDVVEVRDTPWSGAQHGVGVYAYNNTGGPYTITVTDVAVTDYQKNAFALNGDGLTANLLRVNTTGNGPTTVTAQNGIQFGFGSSGTITDCYVADNAWIWVSGDHWSAAGYLLWEAGAVTVLNSVADGNQVNCNFVDASGSYTGGAIYGEGSTPDYSSGIDISNYSATKRAGRVAPQPLLEEGRNSDHGERLDDPRDEVVSISGVTMLGANAPASYGVFAYSDVANLDVSVTNCTIGNWETGVLSYVDGGTINNATVTGNVLSNTYNAMDNVTGHTWDANCWSDFTANSGFPTQYDIYDWATTPNLTNNDFNPNPNGCADVNLNLSSTFIGCNSTTCNYDTLYLTLDEDSIATAEIIFNLPANLQAAWGSGILNLQTFAWPGWTTDPALFFSFAEVVGLGTQIKVNIGWQVTGAVNQRGSSGNPSHCVAAIPVKNVGTTDCSELVVSASSMTIVQWMGVGNQPIQRTDIMVASAGMMVDCDLPSATLGGGGGAGGCTSYGSESSFLNQLNYTMDAVGSLGCLTPAPLDYAFIKLGATQWAIPVGNGNFPTGAESPSVWTTMAEGCNTFELHVFDTECNEKVVTLANIGKDVTIPNLTVGWSQPLCYNNEPLSPQYGATVLPTDLSIDASVGTALCSAQDGILWFSYGSDSIGTPYADLDVADYPLSGAALWDWMNNYYTVPNNYTFTVHVKDCAGNETTNTFSVCMDFTLPVNSFSILDARPTGVGCWLKWSWDPTNLVEARIYRSVYNAAEYAAYNTPVWNNFGTDAEYEQNYYDADLNWIWVATLTPAQTTSNLYPGVYGGPGGAYWLYRPAAWDTVGLDTEQRDVYRFVTFVKDAAGNWSQLGAYSPNVNADRSTNYWLGDFTMDTDNDMPGNASSGAVEGGDLSIFTGSYFKLVGSGAEARCDIGPETGFPGGENAVGKGIPMPDDTVNFLDLIPFSFNFYTTGYTTYSEWPLIADPPSEDGLDASTVVSFCRVDDAEIGLGDAFTIRLTVSGNDDNALKGVEALLTYDPEVLEFVTASTGDAMPMDGELFSVSRPYEGVKGTIGAAVAACGPTAVLSGDFTLATVTFKWKSERVAQTEIALTSVRMFDEYASILSGSGGTMSVGAEGILPMEYALYQNYPNPFNPTTTIRFDLKAASDVRLVIYNVMGQEVRTLAAGAMEAGKYTMAWDGTDNSGHSVTSGLYLYRITAGTFESSRKMLLTR